MKICKLVTYILIDFVVPCMPDFERIVKDGIIYFLKTECMTAYCAAYMVDS